MNIIERLRRDMNLTQLEFANLIGVSTVTLSKYENDQGLENMSIDVLCRLSKLVPIDANYLLEELLN